jgi:hypothetical protein
MATMVPRSEKGHRIEMLEWRYVQRICENPEKEEEHMSGHESEIADYGGG